MRIKRIKASNFKSFDEIQVSFEDFNILVGANASGKSNLIDILRFLRDIEKHGLDNAISIQGGPNYITNLCMEGSHSLSIEITWDLNYTKPVVTKKESSKGIVFKVQEATDELVLGFDEDRSEAEVIQSTLSEKGKLFELEETEEEIEEGEEIGPGKWSYQIKDGKVEIKDKELPQEVPHPEETLLPLHEEQGEAKEPKLAPGDTLIENRFHIAPFVKPPFRDIGIYDFDPKLPKRSTQVTGRADLEEDGENIALVLKRILKDTERKERFMDLIKDFLPFVSNLDIEMVRDKSLIFNLTEKFAETPLPAPLISDGTINITALITALYFEQKSVVIVEEPGRNVHPNLASKIVGMIKDASHNKQIITTTHNPEIVKHADLENLLLVSRDEEGFSNISRPAKKERVQTFLSNEIGIEELYIDQILEG